MDFEINGIFLTEPIFLHHQKAWQKLKYRDRAFKVKKKHFSSFLKGFQLSKIVSTLQCTFKEFPFMG